MSATVARLRISGEFLQPILADKEAEEQQAETPPGLLRTALSVSMLYRYSTVKGVLLLALGAAALAVAAGAALAELSLDGFLLGVRNLAVLVGVELLHELSLHLGLAGFVSSLDGFFLSVGNLAVLIGVELLHELSLAGFELGLHLSLLLLGELGAGTHGAAALAVMTRALVAAALAMVAGAVLLELSLGGFLLGVGELAVLVGVELLHEPGFHLSLAGLAGSLALVAGKFAVFIGIELGEHLGAAGLELSLHFGLLLLSQLGTGAVGAVHLAEAAGVLRGAFGLLRAILSHEGHGSSEQGKHEGFLHGDMFSMV